MIYPSSSQSAANIELLHDINYLGHIRVRQIGFSMNARSERGVLSFRLPKLVAQFFHGQRRAVQDNSAAFLNGNYISNSKRSSGDSNPIGDIDHGNCFAIQIAKVSANNHLE